MTIEAKDIVERLRNEATFNQGEGHFSLLVSEAADEIERLRRELRAMRQDDGAVIAGLQGEIVQLRRDYTGVHRIRVPIKRLETQIERLRADYQIIASDNWAKQTEIERLQTLNAARFKLFQARNDEIVRLRTALQQIASCEKRAEGDVVDIARTALAPK